MIVPSAMTQRRDFTRPAMRCGTGLRPDQARFQSADKIEHGPSPKLPLQKNGPIRVHSARLENGLGEINPESCNSHVGTV